jgi:hypothetical protein
MEPDERERKVVTGKVLLGWICEAHLRHRGPDDPHEAITRQANLLGYMASSPVYEWPAIGARRFLRARLPRRTHMRQVDACQGPLSEAAEAPKGGANLKNGFVPRSSGGNRSPALLSIASLQELRDLPHAMPP